MNYQDEVKDLSANVASPFALMGSSIQNYRTFAAGYGASATPNIPARIEDNFGNFAQVVGSYSGGAPGTFTVTQVRHNNLGGTTLPNFTPPVSILVNLQAEDLNLLPSFQYGAQGQKQLPPWFYWISVTDPQFGADPTGVTDSSAAIRAAINAAASLSSNADTSQWCVYFPSGIYTVTQTGLFTQQMVTQGAGIKFVGDGFNTSIIRFGTLTSPTYFYDNGTVGRSYFNTFYDLGFEGCSPAQAAASGVPANAFGFRIFGNSAGADEQGFRFVNCKFAYLQIPFDFEGTNLSSEMRFWGCQFTQPGTCAYRINNQQSFNHEFYGCDWLCSTDVFQCEQTHSVKLFGGNVIMISSTANTYFLNGIGTVGVGSGHFSLDGVRMELRGNFTNLAKIAETAGINFTAKGSTFEDQGSATGGFTNKTNWLMVGGYATATFYDCDIYQFNNCPITVSTTTGGLYGESGTITFRECGLNPRFSDQCALNSYGGAIKARGCRSLGIGAQAAGVHYAPDFDIHGPIGLGQVGSWTGNGTVQGDGSLGNPTWELKTCQIKLSTEAWPSGTTTTEHTLVLPANAIIKNIHLRKPPYSLSADTTSTSFQVTNNGKTVTHLTTTAAAANASQQGDQSSYFYCVGTAIGDRTIRLSTTNAAVTGQSNGGLAMVEYY